MFFPFNLKKVIYSIGKHYFDKKESNTPKYVASILLDCKHEPNIEHEFHCK